MSATFSMEISYWSGTTGRATYTVSGLGTPTDKWYIWLSDGQTWTWKTYKTDGDFTYSVNIANLYDGNQHTTSFRVTYDAAGETGYAGSYVTETGTYTPPGTVTLTLDMASWMPSTYQSYITLSGGGAYASGTSVSPTATVSSGAPYTFVGWYTSASCTGTPVTIPYTITADTTLYAKFNFAWCSVASGVATTALTAGEWNELGKFINAKHSASVSTSSAVSGEPLTADLYNEYANAVSATLVTQYSTCTATKLNALVNAANED